MSKTDWKINNKNIGGIEPNKYYLYSFSLINQVAEKEFKVNLKLEEGKIVFEINIDKDTQNTIFGEFMKQIKISKKGGKSKCVN